jgi:hypothetical protein
VPRLVGVLALGLSLTANVLADEPPLPSESSAPSSVESRPAEAANGPAQPNNAAEDAAPAATEPAAPAATEPADSAATTAATDAAAQVADDPIVCKRVEMTGTRLRKGKVCKPKSEWQGMSDDAKSMMKDHDRKSGTQGREIG